MGQFSKNYRTFYPKNCYYALKIWVWDPGSGKNLFRIPDPGVKKATDPQHWANVSNTTDVRVGARSGAEARIRIYGSAEPESEINIYGFATLLSSFSDDNVHYVTDAAHVYYVYYGRHGYLTGKNVQI